ncbi:Met-10+ like-protein-domain-containing protein [Fennellomyces sp. T-0311]|nr:Met-10+ like-protein-domain-containing protein [Fennellomyces sp. T-0311]
MNAFVPPVQHGMTVLNREAFKKSVKILGMRVNPKHVGNVMKKLSSELLNQPRLRNVVNGENATKLVLLRQDLRQEDIAKLPKEIKKVIDEENDGFEQHTINLDYDYWTADQIFHAVIPVDDPPASYTQIGHIAHMNLKEEFYPWKHLIGQVILDKNKNITSVVNKTNSIDTTFRFFKMEVLAGEDNMIAQVKESGCRFKFDFSKVYWNSRLQTEHDRLIQKFKKDEYICDVFAGVGPFALPAAKKGAIVYANDLNPASYQWLNENIKLNKITKGISTYNLDGREFIRKAVEDLQATSNDWKTFDHFVMNLPATAMEFLGMQKVQRSSFFTSDANTFLGGLCDRYVSRAVS